MPDLDTFVTPTPFILALVSILVLAQGSVIARDDYDLFWNGE
jgi:hypothetical protein